MRGDGRDPAIQGAGASPRATPVLVALAAALAPQLAVAGAATPAGHRTASEWTLDAGEGASYVIRVSVPAASPPAGGYPVIYVLDGDAWVGVAAEIARVREYSRLDPAVIVGVAYPDRRFFDAVRRTRDFTPPGSADAGMTDEGIALGGADRFLEFLNRTLKPQVRERYPVSDEREALFGHSLGGLFVLHALFRAPESFETWVAASPSMFFSDGIVRHGEAAFLANPARRAPRVLITAGEFETPKPSPAQVEDYRRYFTANPDLLDGRPVKEALAELFAPRANARGRHTASEACALAERLAQAGVRARFALFAGEEHTSSAVSALNRAIPFALRPAPAPSADVAGDGQGCAAARRLVEAPGAADPTS